MRFVIQLMFLVRRGGVHNPQSLYTTLLVLQVTELQEIVSWVVITYIALYSFLCRDHALVPSAGCSDPFVGALLVPCSPQSVCNLIWIHCFMMYVLRSAVPACIPQLELVRVFTLKSWVLVPGLRSYTSLYLQSSAFLTNCSTCYLPHCLSFVTSCDCLFCC